jgi:hypothetical protein
MRNYIEGVTRIKITDEYGQVMYEPAIAAAMKIFIGGATQIQVTDPAGKLLYEMGLGAGAHPPEGAGPSPLPPVEVTPPPSGGSGGSGAVGSPAPPSGSEIPWPASGQVLYYMPMQQLQTVSWTMQWLSKMDPNKVGYVSVVEEPGSAVMFRHLKISVNGVLKFDSTPYKDTAPSCGLVNAPTPGSLSQVQMNHGDVLGIEVTNGENSSAQPSNMLLEIATPDRH